VAANNGHRELVAAGRQFAVNQHERDREAGALLNLGAVCQRQERLDLAQTYFEQALAIYTDLNFKDGTAKTLGFLGILPKKKDEFGEALARCGGAA
jgi:tetratricopeptide (TPR) repeat protein